MNKPFDCRKYLQASESELSFQLHKWRILKQATEIRRLKIHQSSPTQVPFPSQFNALLFCLALFGSSETVEPEIKI
jgi:hypothetical protein